jgi:lipopolysaccharide export system protein LptA
MGKAAKIVFGLMLTASILVMWAEYVPLAAEQEKGPAGLDLRVGSEPIQISARTLVWDHKGQKATFQQEVIARQQDLEIQSDDLTVYFNENENDITRLVAKGNVRIIQMDRRAYCEEAVYDRALNRIVLEGNPVIRQGQNEVKGERVIFYLEENRSVVEGGERGRVKVTLVPEKEKLEDRE